MSDPAEKIDTNEIVGLKKFYMSPEQENEGKHGMPADIWFFG